MTRRLILRGLSLLWRAAPSHVVALVFLAIGGGLLPLAMAWYTKLLVDDLAETTTPDRVLGLAGTIAAAGVLSALLPHFEQYASKETDRRSQLLATSELYSAVDRFVGLPRFEDPAFLDRLQLSRSAGTAAPAQLFNSLLRSAQAVVTVLGFAVALAVLEPWAAIVVVFVGTVPAVTAQLALSRRRVAMLAATSQSERRELFYSGLLTDPRAAKEVRLFGAGRFLWRKMAAEIRTVNGQHRSIDRRTLLIQGASATVGAVTAGLLLLWAVAEVLAGRLSIGDVVLVAAAVAAVQGALTSLVEGLISGHQTVLLFAHYQAVIDSSPDLPTSPQPTKIEPLRTAIELRDVWFRYTESQPWVLQGVNLLLPRGQTTALVGLNGAGKSTIVKLICRLYDPDLGTVSWDGIDLRHVVPSDLRQRIRAIFQDATAYDLTATENIAMGDLSAINDAERVEFAAREAGVHKLITTLPSGYNTPLTRIFMSQSEAGLTEGVTLSGGQWQRIALARGLMLPDPDLLILDEPTAALDAEAEHEVHATLRAHRHSRTSLLISHRLNAVRDADNIVVLADGQIAEQGTHHELVTQKGAYARLFNLQASGYQDDSL